MENKAKQSEILFIWDAKMCNPNGDMSMDNAPRFDDVDEKAIVSDVRIKRTIRDDLQYRKENNLIFINNEEITSKELNAESRFDDLKSDGKDDKEVFLSCIDNRLFGGVAPKSGIQLIGPVQFSWTKSLNKTETILKSGTGAFVNKNKNNNENGKHQKTFRVDNYLPYAVFAMYGTINLIHAERCNTSEDDIKNMLDSLWFGTKFLNTRSKQGQKPRFLMRIVYKEKSKYFIGLLDELVKISNEDSSTIRNIDEVKFDFTVLCNALKNAKNEIEEIQYVVDASIEESVNDFKEQCTDITFNKINETEIYL